ncbi:MAG: DUF3365 domain-containing protein, partial [Rhodobiaceae bacterium]|nr:DUF3365 domain-containing protein [Rhodobiaceae bacterium]
MDAIGRFFINKPQWIAAFVLVALVMLPVAVWLDLRNLSDNALTQQATSLNTMISDIRGYYARNVVGRIVAHDGKTVTAHNYEAIPGAVPIPATLSIEMGDLISRRHDGLQYRFVSDYVFKNRTPHILDDFEKKALAEFRSSRDPEAVETNISGSLFNRTIRIAVPVVMGAACVACHNTHPESPKRDWKVGDVRAIQEVEVEQPIARNIWSFKYLLTYFAAAGLFGFAFTGIQVRQALHFRRM